MANLTLAIDAQLLKDARAVAFERETTLTEMIREYLKELSRELAIKRRMEARQLMKSIERNSRHFGGITWTREDLYERR
jgi:hypothetical protein